MPGPSQDFLFRNAGNGSGFLFKNARTVSDYLQIVQRLFCLGWMKQFEFDEDKSSKHRECRRKESNVCLAEVRNLCIFRVNLVMALTLRINMYLRKLPRSRQKHCTYQANKNMFYSFPIIAAHGLLGKCISVVCCILTVPKVANRMLWNYIGL